MTAVEIIRAKRDGRELTAGQIAAFVRAAAHGEWPDYQLSALLMAIFLNGMTVDETAALTRQMADSGTVLDLSDIPGAKVDKHSTGGVGDKVSLVLAPLAAACGVTVPMMSGRGLGHTGGTLDKLEAIPGFRVNLSEDEFRAALRTVGCAMIGQTAEVAPADKKLYALRDVTGTVESIPLITASILSKKLAEGISGLVMDVKCGRGAFMKTLPDARALAESIQRVGTANGLKVVTMITAMDAPLGRAVGNSLEVIEAIETLKGNGPVDLMALSVCQTERMAWLAEKGRPNVVVRLQNGMALDKFREMVQQQGGNPDVVDDYSLLPLAPDRATVVAKSAGFVNEMNAEAVGIAAMTLGAGRLRADDAVDHGVGVMVRKKPGEAVTAGDVVFEIYHRAGKGLPRATELLEGSFTVTDSAPPATPLVIEVLG